MVDVSQALAVDAMSTLTQLLEHPSDKIKTLAALTIFHLRSVFKLIYGHFTFIDQRLFSVSLKGKERAVQIGTVDRLVGLLDSQNDQLRSKSALALSM